MKYQFIILHKNYKIIKKKLQKLQTHVQRTQILEEKGQYVENYVNYDKGEDGNDDDTTTT